MKEKVAGKANYIRCCCLPMETSISPLALAHTCYVKGVYFHRLELSGGGMNKSEEEGFGEGFGRRCSQ